MEKQHRQLTGAKARLGQQMDSLDIMDKFYEKKYQDMIQDIVCFVLANLREQMDIIHIVGRQDQEKEIR